MWLFFLPRKLSRTNVYMVLASFFNWLAANEVQHLVFDIEYAFNVNKTFLSFWTIILDLSWQDLIVMICIFMNKIISVLYLNRIRYLCRVPSSFLFPIKKKSLSSGGIIVLVSWSLWCNYLCVQQRNGRLQHTTRAIVGTS